MTISPDGKYHYFISFIGISPETSERITGCTTLICDNALLASPNDRDVNIIVRALGSRFNLLNCVITAITLLAEPAPSVVAATRKVRIHRPIGDSVEVYIDSHVTPVIEASRSANGSGGMGLVVETATYVAHALGAEVVES